MKDLSLKTKKQVVLSRIIYDYIINGLADSLNSISDKEQQLLIMRINIQAITHAIDISQEKSIEDFNYSFNQLGVSFKTLVPLSDVEFSASFIDKHIDLIRNELGEDFEEMLLYLEKMESTVG